MKLTVLGSEPAWPSPLRACSGYLLTTDNGRILIDCGTGVLERLRDVIRPDDLTAIVITHLHFDHWADLIPMRYYFSLDPTADKSRCVPLYLPPNGEATVQAVVAPITNDESFLAEAFDVREYDPMSRACIGDVSVDFLKTTHPIDTYALRIELEGRAFTFSADSGWQSSIAEFAQDSDLFMCEAAFGIGESTGNMHLTASEAGKLAVMASAKSLLLTHLAHTMAPASIEAAKQEFSGTVRYAEPGETFDI